MIKKCQAYERVILANKSETKAAQLQEEEFKLEIFNLKVLNQEMQQFKEPIKEKEKKEDNPEDDVVDSEKIFDKMGKEIGESQRAISALENEQNSKKEILLNMDKLLKQVLQFSKQDKGIQCDEANLQWTPKNMIDSVLSQPLPKIEEKTEEKESVKPNETTNENQKEEETDTKENLEKTEQSEKYKEKYKYEAPTSNLTKPEEVSQLK